MLWRAISLFFLGPIRSAVGGANAESRWCDSGQLPLLSGRQGPQQKLQDTAQGLLSMCVAHTKHGRKVKHDTHVILVAFIEFRISSDLSLLLHAFIIYGLLCAAQITAYIRHRGYFI